MKSYGISTGNEIKSKEDAHLEEFYKFGYTVIENVLSADDLAILRTELDRVYALQEAEFGKEKLKAINEENLARFPLVWSDAYASLASRKDLTSYVSKILGDYHVLHLQNGVINMPGKEHHQSSWHRDLPYQNWTSSEPLGCNLYYCIDEFNEATGATFLLPFSHSFEKAPSAGFFDKHAVQVKAPAGSVILFDCMVFHRAGYNSTKNTIRRGVNHMYVRPFISQQINLPQLLNGKYSDDPYLKMLFGYQTQLSNSVNEYRSKRLNK